MNWILHTTVLFILSKHMFTECLRDHMLQAYHFEINRHRQGTFWTDCIKWAFKILGLTCKDQNLAQIRGQSTVNPNNHNDVITVTALWRETSPVNKGNFGLFLYKLSPILYPKLTLHSSTKVKNWVINIWDTVSMPYLPTAKHKKQCKLVWTMLNVGMLAEHLMHMADKVGNNLGVSKSPSDWSNSTGFPQDVCITFFKVPPGNKDAIKTNLLVE